MTSGRVSFVGAGPGAADLITLRGAKRIAEADVVVWTANLVDPACVREHARPDAELIDSSRITHEEVLDVYRRAAAQRLVVARVHSGDPSLWGAVQEQYDSCQRLGLDVEIVPGVSAFSAAAAIAGRELTVPEVAQSVILTRLEGGRTPMPDGEHIRDFARHGTTMAIFVSAARSGQLVEELRAGGYTDDTPVVIAYKVTWPDELVLHTTVGELEETVKRHKLWRHTLFLVGTALRADGTRSHPYGAGHFHTYRKADPVARRESRAAERAAAGPGTAEATPAEHAGKPVEPGGESVDPAARTGGGAVGLNGVVNGTAGTDGAVAAEGRARVGGWPLQTSRTGRVAARVSPGRSTEQPVGATGQRAVPAGQESVAAWSAVHEWQETARSASRGGVRTRPTGDAPRAARSTRADQGAFVLDTGSTASPTRTRTAATPAEGTGDDGPAVDTDVVDAVGASADSTPTGEDVVRDSAAAGDVAQQTDDDPKPAEDTPDDDEPIETRAIGNQGAGNQGAGGVTKPRLTVVPSPQGTQRQSRQGTKRTSQKRNSGGKPAAR